MANEEDSQIDQVMEDIMNFCGPYRTVLQKQPKILVDIVNEEKILTIYAEIPGIKKDKINIEFFNNKLTISGIKEKNYFSTQYPEILYGKFERNVLLPFSITKKESVNVQYDLGVLIIKIDKTIEEKNRFGIKINEN